MGSGIHFLVMDDDMMKMLPKNLDSRISWDKVQNEFGSTEIIFVAFGGKDSSAYSAHALDNLWQLSENLELLESVREVINISSSTKIEQYDGFMEIDDLQPSEKLTRNEIDGIKAYLNKNPKLKKRLISKNENYLITMIQPEFGFGLDRFRNDVVHVADSLLADYEIHYGGTAYVLSLIHI